MSAFACPSRALDVPAWRCEAPAANYGSSENPLEWGPGASGRTLFFERLVCPNGATPVTRKVGVVGPAKVPSRSPKSSPVAPDVLEDWLVGCPSEVPLHLTVNPGRCGDPCPPAGLSLLPAAAAVALDRSQEALVRGDVDVAMAQARIASDSAPLTEATAGWKGMVQLEAGWALQAMQSFAAAGALNQDDPFYPAQQAAALERLDEPDKADRMLRRVLEDLDDTHPARARIQCQRAYLWRRMRNPDAGALAAEACAAGVDNCCPQRWGR